MKKLDSGLPFNSFYCSYSFTFVKENIFSLKLDLAEKMTRSAAKSLKLRASLSLKICMYSVYLIIVLGMLSAFGPFVIDM